MDSLDVRKNEKGEYEFIVPRDGVAHRFTFTQLFLTPLRLYRTVALTRKSVPKMYFAILDDVRDDSEIFLNELWDFKHGVVAHTPAEATMLYRIVKNIVDCSADAAHLSHADLCNKVIENLFCCLTNDAEEDMDELEDITVSSVV